ncbi:MAG: sulfatase-like hydrolase/transferase [Planctomycetota bacterium]|nr:sulfatase-like hydrolase/transferase [Planctomycetota bacterium]
MSTLPADAPDWSEDGPPPLDLPLPRPTLRERLSRIGQGLLRRARELWSPASGWYLAALAWCAFALLSALLLAFRCVMTSEFAQFLQVENIPVLKYVEGHYAKIYVLGLGCGGLFFAGLFAGWTTLRQGRLWWLWPALTLLALGAAGWANRFSVPGAQAPFAETWNALRSGQGVPKPEVAAPGAWDWLAACWVCAAAAAAVLALTRSESRAAPKARPAVLSLFARLSMLYLLGCLSILAYAILDHRTFWDAGRNGGYHYERFFAPGEPFWLNAVLYSTSWLFASLATGLICAGCAALGLIERWLDAVWRERLRVAALAALWSAALMLPWLIKLLPEIRSSQAWILPFGLVACVWGALAPALAVAAIWLRRDLVRQEGETGVESGDGERALLAFALFPFYPLLRLVRPPSGWKAWLWPAALIVLAGAVLGGLTWGEHWADEHYELDDWRDMIRSGLFPTLRALFAVACASWVYVSLSRLARHLLPPEGAAARGGWRAARIGAAVLGAAGLLFALWPFWGWHTVPKNVFARAAEFSNRYEFELGFLHWLFDFDRDGYAGVLGGADADDRDPDVQAGGLPRPLAPEIPDDVFEIRDAERARTFPSVAIVFLEGVAPRFLDVYGQRKLADGRLATPHMDGLARDGALFLNARCTYPSTWDGWYMVNAGRFLRITEMDNSRSFGEHYARHANLQKVLKLLGATRYAFADTTPYVDLFVPFELRALNFEPDLDSDPSRDEEERGITRGDKRTERLIRFIDDLQPGERFFFCEHMVDTHFPWHRVERARAAELGYPDGMAFVEEDAIIDGQKNERLAKHQQSVTRMDTQVGRILDKLKEKGLYDSTLVILVSDHGCQWYEHEHCYYVSHLYEQSLRIPLLVKMPGCPAGITVEAPVLQTDLFPTILELAGIEKVRPARPLDGVSLVPLLRGDPGADPARYARRDLILTTHYDTLGAIHDFREKLIIDRPTGALWLFDLAEDPMETRNLADARPELLQRMLDLLRELNRRHPEFVAGFKQAPDDHGYEANPRR